MPSAKYQLLIPLNVSLFRMMLLQDDICRIFNWSLELKLEFNIPMCVLSLTSGDTPDL